MWSINIAVVERSPDMEVRRCPIPSTKIKTHEALREPHCTEGTFEHERRAPQ
jgi:hypothetical protein